MCLSRSMLDTEKHCCLIHTQALTQFPLSLSSASDGVGDALAHSPVFSNLLLRKLCVISSVIHTSEETGLVKWCNFHRFEKLSIRTGMWTGSSNSKITAFPLYCVNFHERIVGAKRGGIFPTKHPPPACHVQNPPSFTSMFSSSEWHKLAKMGEITSRSGGAEGNYRGQKHLFGGGKHLRYL